MGVVEAEAMAVPVIISNINGPRDAMIPEKTGFIVSKKSVDELEEAMERIMAVDRQSLGEAGKKFARESFEQQEFFKKILEDRKKLLGE